MEIFFYRKYPSRLTKTANGKMHTRFRVRFFNDVTELIYLKDYLYDSFDLFNFIFQLFYFFNLITI